ncbi:MAG: NAD(P)H-dependent oxidoreductase [Candidatus Gracilibacteria bacterium]|nr:NAD(P)H-dependent oxidoreductase [Candidatus Gracilibacteria bacterium]
MSELIKKLQWRYATKDFDTNKKVSDSDLEDIIEAFRLTPSSFGLEPWKLVIVENPEIRQELQAHSWNQSQITKASHLLVFARVKNIDDAYIDKYLENNSKITGVSREDLVGYEGMMKGYFSSLDEQGKILWASEQVFLALGNVMNLLAQKEIDSCAIGGFNPVKYDEVLDLDKHGLASVVVLPIGYRSSEDKYASKPKVRFSKEEVVLKI